MDWKEKFKTLVRADFERRRAQNSAYSLRTFSRDLKVSAPTMSQFLSDQLDLSADRAANVLEHLEIRREDKEYILALMGKEVPRVQSGLPQEHIKIFSDWIYLAVLHFFDLEDISKDHAALSKRLAVSESKISEVVGHLLSMGYLEEVDGGLRKKDLHFVAGDGPSNGDIRNFHKENLKVAEKALESVPSELRDFSAITFCGRTDKMDLIRKEIRSFHHRISTLMVSDRPRTDVFRLSIMLFPFRFGE